MNRFLKEWGRRLTVVGVTGVFVYGFSIGVAIYFAIYNQVWNPRLKWLNAWDIRFKDWLSSVVPSGSWSQFVTNEFREHFSFVHFLITLGVVLTVGIFVGWLVNKWLKGTRTFWERCKISFWGALWGIVLLMVLYTMKVWSPAGYAMLAAISHAGWQWTRWVLEFFERSQPVGMFLSLTLTRPFGHSIMFATIANMIAFFLLNAWYALKRRAE